MAPKESNTGRTAHIGYNFAKLEMKYYHYPIDVKNLSDQLAKNNLKIYENTRKIDFGQNDD